MLTKEEAENKILKYANVDISPKVQDELNRPLGHPGGISAEDRDFLEMLVAKIGKNEIDLYKPSSLLNRKVYDNLDESARAKAELDALNMLNAIREIHRLWQAEQKATYQLENLVHRVRVTKERLEEAGGDIYII